jgi:fluoroacetyl-CoA thioesterase
MFMSPFAADEEDDLIETGLKCEHTWVVEDRHLASALGSGLLPVLGAPALAALCEAAALKLVEGLLPPGKQSVGTWISLRHLAAAPSGMRVTARAELVAVKKRLMRFRIEVWDEVERIGYAEHERLIVDTEKFRQRIDEKARRMDGSVTTQMKQ